MKRDIENDQDIKILVDSFYEKVKKDDLIAYLFTDVAEVNWSVHLPRMYEFWSSVLFYSGGYMGNPMQVHRALHHKSPLAMSHFQRWNELFAESVDQLFEGENATLIKQRAMSISTVMQIKIFG